MAEPGYIVVWIDPDRDVDAARGVMNAAYPGFKAHFVNPRWFDGSITCGVSPPSVRGHVMATQDERVRDAYAAANINYQERDDFPKIGKAPKPVVLIYSRPGDNDHNDYCRSYARKQYPKMPLQIISEKVYQGPIPDPVRAVLVHHTQQRIIADYVAGNREVVPIGDQGDRGPPTTENTIDKATLDATLDLEAQPMQSIVSAQIDVTWLRALADQEATRDNRQDVQVVIHARMIELGESNPHYDGIDQPQPAEESHVETHGFGPDQLAAFLDRSKRAMSDEVAAIQSAEFAEALANTEAAGQGRTSIWTMLTKRADELRQ